MSNGSHKGSDFERQICKELSLWWTKGERDDVFWRTSGSGARATTRAKTGKPTYQQYGDVQAVDPIGEPFTQLFSIEIKRGYKWDLTDILCTKVRKNAHPLIEFVQQALQSAHQGGALFPMVITKQDRRPTLVILPSSFFFAYMPILHASYKGKDLGYLKPNQYIRIKTDAADLFLIGFEVWKKWAEPDALHSLLMSSSPKQGNK